MWREIVLPRSRRDRRIAVTVLGIAHGLIDVHGNHANRTHTGGACHKHPRGTAGNGVGGREGRIVRHRPHRFNRVGGTDALPQFKYATRFAARGIDIEQDAGDGRVRYRRIDHRGDLSVRDHPRCRLHTECATHQRAVDGNDRNARCAGALASGHGVRRQPRRRLGPADALAQHREDHLEFGACNQERRPVQTRREMG